MSWIEAEGGGHALRVARLRPGGAGPVGTAVRADDLFVNWADIPMVVATAGGRWVAHYLQRGAQGGYDYGIRVVVSDDGGQTWSDPTSLHTDDTPTEHGFVSAVPDGRGGVDFVWLDGRRHIEGPEGPATGAMTLRHRVLRADLSWSEEQVLDAMVCDCCQTGAAATRTGWAVAYRDRTPNEVRDIHVGRMGPEGWSPGGPVHDDGWVMPACPVNGPALDARGERVVVSWYTAADSTPRVQVAFSGDGGASFGSPVRIDEGDPVGRTDVVMDRDGGAWVAWVERRGVEAEVRLRHVSPDGSAADPVTLARTVGARAAGFPRLARWPAGGLVLAWTDPDPAGSRVRLAHVSLPGAARAADDAG